MSETDVVAEANQTPETFAGMKVEMVPLDDLMLDKRNARRGNVSVIIDSLKEFGQHRPLVARRDNNQIIVGNHMYKAARALGWTEMAVVFVDDDEEKAVRRGIADNATGDKAGWDEALLATLLQEVGELPGFTDNEISRLVSKLGVGETDESKEEPIYPIVARPNEKYDYVLVVAQSEMDWAFLQTFFELRREKSYKRDTVGLSRVVTVDRLQQIIDNRK